MNGAQSDLFSTRAALVCAMLAVVLLSCEPRELCADDPGCARCPDGQVALGFALYEPYQPCIPHVAELVLCADPSELSAGSDCLVYGDKTYASPHRFFGPPAEGSAASALREPPFGMQRCVADHPAYEAPLCGEWQCTHFWKGTPIDFERQCARPFSIPMGCGPAMSTHEAMSVYRRESDGVVVVIYHGAGGNVGAPVGWEECNDCGEVAAYPRCPD
ncbi:MAG: hypothetical protein RBU37_05280 [Myxococcota bacterium]|jgi:hypothetical protein|nr:hypothetical protein [Myxococcota bacterium]